MLGVSPTQVGDEGRQRSCEGRANATHMHPTHNKSKQNDLFREGKCCVLGRVYFICNYRPDSRVWRGTAARSRQPWLPRTNGGEFNPFVGRARPPPLLPTQQAEREAQICKTSVEEGTSRCETVSCDELQEQGSSRFLLGVKCRRRTTSAVVDKHTVS